MPPAPAPPLPLVGFDPVAAAALAAALDQLADALRAARRADEERQAELRRDWQGFTRSWFDQRHAEVADLLVRASALAAEAGQETRRAVADAATALHQADVEHRAQLARHHPPER